jgi:hypothetical protein
MDFFSDNARNSSDKSLENLDKPTKDAVQSNTGNKPPRNQGRGFGNSKKIEPVPTFSIAESEVLLQNDNNARIVLGRDRNDNLASGYGGAGFSESAAIDLVVGSMAGSKTGPKDKQKVDPNFFSDAARVYISQKADIDDYFGLAEGQIGSIKSRSSIGIKADAVRIIAREGGIKIVTGKGNSKGWGNGGETNANGGKIKFPKGVELIGGNDTEDRYITDFFGFKLVTKFKLPSSERVARLQPMVKGENLEKCLNEIVESIEDINTALLSFVRMQEIYNTTTSTNISAVTGLLFPAAVAGSIQTAVTTSTKITNLQNVTDVCSKLTANVTLLRMNYLKETSALYINSREHKLT